LIPALMCLRFSRWPVVAGLAAGLICVGQDQGLGLAQVSAPVPNAPAPPPKATPAARFVVVLDAAHGGDDGGGLVGAGLVGAGQGASGVAEKVVTLALSVRLRSLLTARGFSVVTTREGNVNLSPDARAQIANHGTSGATGTACLSLHASEAGSGVHIFVSALAAASPARFPAWKTAQSAYVDRSLKLAGTVNSALEHSSVGTGSDSAGAGGESGEGAIPATLARASLPGMNSMTCPAVAIEIAPIRSADRKVATEVTDPQYQTQIVEALAAALLEWKTDQETDSHTGGRLP
jgi:N-acetylmuramoyl-L-alanine amidase